MKTTVRLTESAVMLAVAVVLSLIPVVNMPFGGTVTLCSMLPIVLIAYRHGTKWGLLVGLAGSLLQLLLGLNNLSYATSALAVVAIILFDYVIAFSALGLAGVFRNVCRTQTAALTAGVLLCCVLRYACHFVSGVTVWRDISIPADQAILYSLGYNAAYMVPETIITLAGALALSTSLDLRSDRPRAAKTYQGRALVTVLTLVCIAAAAVAAVALFGAMQTEDGFDVTAVTSSALWTVGVGAIVAAASGIAAASVAKKNG
ncbi:MAG: energy-coupled thiamine transporter ThiT [Clostridia bacterium]|nr:energy-coupled thiamine transporter ThiT [Clostridia bacterium]